MRALRYLFIVVSLLLLISVPACQNAAETEALYGVESGPYNFEVKEMLVLHDGVRDKDLQLRVTYPDGNGQFPVILWSHGLGGTKDVYQPIVQHWVSHGYVCIQMDHSDSRQLTLNPDFADWANRPKDISFIIDSLDDIQEALPEFEGSMDKTTIGLGGHSYGAHTTQLVGGAKVRQLIAGQATDYSDERPLAFLMISPQGTGDLLDEHSWDSFARPAMTITGTKDLGRQGDPYTWRLEPYNYMPLGNKYLLIIEEAWHGFGGITGNIEFRGRGPDNPKQVNYVKSASIAFWDAYLKQDRKAMAYLTSDTLTRLSEEDAKLTRK